MLKRNYLAALAAIIARSPEAASIRNDEPRLQDLLERRQAVINRRRQRIETAENEDRDLNEEEAAAEAADVQETDQLTNRIQRIQALGTAPAPPADPPADPPAPNPGPANVDPPGQPGGGGGLPHDPARTPGVANIQPPRVLAGRMHAYDNTQAGRASAYRDGVLLVANVFGSDAIYRALDVDGQRCVDHCREQVRNAMGGGSAGAGAEYVPEEWTSRVIDLEEVYGVYRRNMMVNPMGSDTLNVPKKQQRVSVSWTPEGDPATPSDQVTANVQLVAQKLLGLTVISSELNEDNIVGLTDRLAVDFAIAFANAEDDAAFNGDGNPAFGNITGFLNFLGAGSKVTGAGAAFGDLTFANFEEAIGKTPYYPGTVNKWYISKAGFYASMQRLIDTVGGINRADVERGASMSFLGHDVEWTQVLPQALAAQPPGTPLLYFGDLSMASEMGQRSGSQVVQSMHAYFANDQIGVRARQRTAITLHEGDHASNPGPVVAIVAP